MTYRLKVAAERVHAVEDVAFKTIHRLDREADAERCGNVSGFVMKGYETHVLDA